MIVSLQIANNPHLKPDDAEEFAEELFSRREELYDDESSVMFDRQGMDALKQQLRGQSPHIGVSK